MRVRSAIAASVVGMVGWLAMAHGQANPVVPLHPADEKDSAGVSDGWPHAVRVGIADVTADGVTRITNARRRIRRGDERGGLAGPSSVILQAQPRSFELADFHDDGRLDASAMASFDDAFTRAHPY